MVRMVPIADSDGRSGFSQRLRQAAIDYGYPEHGMGAEIARVMGLSPKAINKWMNAQSMPDTKRLDRLAAHLRVSAEWLLTGRVGIPGQGFGVPYPLKQGVPVIDRATVDVVCSDERAIPATMARDTAPPPAMNNYGPRTFAFRQTDDTMTATAGPKSYPVGCLVYVDPDRREPAHDKPVLARLQSGEIVLACYMAQAGRVWLRLLNNAYPPITEPFEVVGVVIWKGEEP